MAVEAQASQEAKRGRIASHASSADMDRRLEEARTILSQTEEEVEMKRLRYEADSYGGKKSLGGDGERGAPKMSEADRFLKAMADRGSGNIALAWRRYFDNDGDGDLNFREFCKALMDMRYKGDVPQLWVDLLSVGGNDSNTLSLHALDPDNAAVLETFGTWCRLSKGGPIEIFSCIDDDGSDSLTPDEFVVGLRGLGFFEQKGLPARVKNEQEVLKNLYPLLDQCGHGCVTPEQLLFLEKDRDKRVRLDREFARARQHGKGTFSAEPLQKEGDKLLHQLAMETSMLGGRSWRSGRGMKKSTRRLVFGKEQKRLKPSLSCPSLPAACTSTSSPSDGDGGDTRRTFGRALTFSPSALPCDNGGSFGRHMSLPALAEVPAQLMDNYEENVRRKRQTTHSLGRTGSNSLELPSVFGRRNDKLQRQVS